MSRRTQLIILALFLVLLAIPTAYVALTWSPSHALSFRVVPLRNPSPRSDDYLTQMSVRVENTSSTTIYLHYASLHKPRKAAWAIESLGSINPEDQPASGKPDDAGGFRIPSHGSIDVIAFVGRDEMQSARAGQLHVSYTSVSYVKHKATHLCVWLYNLVPERFSTLVPMPEADAFEAGLEALVD